jgi:transcriptional regulator with XRE-family HTH domain
VKMARMHAAKDQSDLGSEMGLHRITIGKWENGQVVNDNDYKAESFERAAQKVTGLPREFFSIKLDDLPNMVKAWKQVSRLPDPGEAQALVDEKLRRDQKRR